MVGTRLYRVRLVFVEDMCHYTFGLHLPEYAGMLRQCIAKTTDVEMSTERHLDGRDKIHCTDISTHHEFVTVPGHDPEIIPGRLEFTQLNVSSEVVIRLEMSKVGENDLKEVYDNATGDAHASVSLVESLRCIGCWLLNKQSACAVFA